MESIAEEIQRDVNKFKKAYENDFEKLKLNMQIISQHLNDEKEHNKHQDEELGRLKMRRQLMPVDGINVVSEVSTLKDHEIKRPSSQLHHDRSVNRSRERES